MKIRKIVFGIFVSIFLMMSSSTFLWSGEPGELVKEIIITDSSLDKTGNIQEQRLKQWEKISHAFNFEWMSRKVIYIYWNNLSTKEKSEFVELFKNTLKNAYLKSTSPRFGDKIVSLTENQYSQYARVQTILIKNTGTKVSANFRLIIKGGKWKIYDVVIEGVSILNNYRSQITNILAHSSYEDLVKIMKQKQGQE